MTIVPPDLTDSVRRCAREKGATREETDRIFVAAYQQLRRIASGVMRSQRPDHTLRPTEVLHQAYEKLVRAEYLSWTDRAHFLRIAARAMRQVLINYAKNRAAAKRGGQVRHLTIDSKVGAPNRVWEVLSLDRALDHLAAEDERMATVVELRIFGGMKIAEIAHVLGVSPRTINNLWRVATGFLRDELRVES